MTAARFNTLSARDVLTAVFTCLNAVQFHTDQTDKLQKTKSEQGTAVIAKQEFLLVILYFSTVNYLS